MFGFIITDFEAQLMEEVIDPHMETNESLLHDGIRKRLQQYHYYSVAFGTATHIGFNMQSMLNSSLSPLKNQT